MIGQIYPPKRPSVQTSPASAWNGVGDAFAQAGDNIRDALKEFRERVMRIAESYAQADVRRKDRDSLADLITPIIAQVITLILGGAGIAAVSFFPKPGMRQAVLLLVFRP
ncbi:MAG: hypothetical protein LBU17_07130 [Treponema sp.]|nr:hypothetical protein [Treponema sp.]